MTQNANLFFVFLYLFYDDFYKAMIIFVKSDTLLLYSYCGIVYPCDFWFAFVYIPLHIFHSISWASFSLDDFMSERIIECMSDFLLNWFDYWFERSSCSFTEEFSSEREYPPIDRIFCHNFKINIRV